MHLDLFKPVNTALIDSPTKANHNKEVDPNPNSLLIQEDSSYQKYESPKFFIGSGSPVRKSNRLDEEDLLEE